MSAFLPCIWMLGSAVCLLADWNFSERRAQRAAGIGMAAAAIGGALGAPAAVQILLFICALRWLVFRSLGRPRSAAGPVLQVGEG